MKLWEKIFICTLIIFEIFFTFASLYLINSNFKLNLKSEIDSGLSEHNRLCSSIESELYMLKMQQRLEGIEDELNKKYVDSVVKTYMNSFANEDVYMQVMDLNNNIIFSSLKIKLPLKRYELNLVTDKSKYIIRDIDKKTYLCVTRGINLENNNYKVSYVKDISNVYANRLYLIDLFIKLNVFMSVILIVVMIILSKVIVKPVNKLIESTQSIAGGNFSDRVSVSSDDEIGILSKNFNYMADVIENKINELQKVSKDKQTFIDNLSHEIRTPLTSIIGYADFLRTVNCDEETRINSLDYIYKEGKRLQELSSKLMELITLRKADFKMKDENIKVLLDDIKNSLIPKLKSRNIELGISSDDFSFPMDKELMKILIINLIDNSIKASKDGDKIYVSVHKDEKMGTILEVKDNGVGIPDEDTSKVIEPFYMVDKSRERANNGAGLGLSLCEQIAEVHNAKLCIQSKIGKGTKIKVIFK